MLASGATSRAALGGETWVTVKVVVAEAQGAAMVVF
jgi:hypothetical protein